LRYCNPFWNVSTTQEIGQLIAMHRPAALRTHCTVSYKYYLPVGMLFLHYVCNVSHSYQSLVPTLIFCTFS